MLLDDHLITGRREKEVSYFSTLSLSGKLIFLLLATCVAFAIVIPVGLILLEFLNNH